MSESVAPSKTEEVQQRVLKFLRSRRSDGNSYVNASLIEDQTGVSTDKLAKTLLILEEKGFLDLWSDAGKSRVYRITEQVFEEGIADD